MTGVQISVDQALAVSVASLASQLNDATETTRSYGRKIDKLKTEVEGAKHDADQAQAKATAYLKSFREIETESNELRYYLDMAGQELNALRAQVSSQAETIGSLQSDVEASRGAGLEAKIEELTHRLESAKNALAERGKTIDYQNDQIDRLTTELAEARGSEAFTGEPAPALKVGDRVRFTGNTYRSFGVVETDTDAAIGDEGTITSGPDSDGDYEIDTFLFLSPESLEVIGSADEAIA